MKILFSEEAIRERVKELGREITNLYRDKPLTVVGLLNGALPFMADLVRAIDLPLQYDTFGASSYQSTTSTGSLKIRSELKLSLAGRHVIIVDDILDTGYTLKCIMEEFQNRGALSVKSCVFLNKEIGKKLFTEPDFVGFSIPPEFVVGYGLDCDEEYRNLPYIGVVE